jgi:hypothetical protein
MREGLSNSRELRAESRNGARIGEVRVEEAGSLNI